MNNHQKTPLFFIVLFTLILSSLAQAADILEKFKVTAMASRTKVPLNQSFQVILTIAYTGEPGDYTISDPFVEKYQNLTLMGNSTENLVQNTTNGSAQKEVVKKYTYILKPGSMGLAYFPVTRISVSDKKGKLLTELGTQSIPIEITEPVVKRDYSALRILLAIIFLLGLLTLGGLQFYKAERLKKEKRKKELELQAVVLTPEDVFFEEWEKIDRITLPEKLDRIIPLFKEYLEKNWKIRIKDKSTKETFELCAKNGLIPEPHLTQIKEILDTSDLIRFNPSPADNRQIQDLIDKIIGFVTFFKELRLYKETDEP